MVNDGIYCSQLATRYYELNWYERRVVTPRCDGHNWDLGCVEPPTRYYTQSYVFGLCDIHIYVVPNDEGPTGEITYEEAVVLGIMEL